MTNFDMFIFFFIVISTFIHTRTLPDLQKRVIIPKLPRIIETNNKIILKKDKEFVKLDFFDFLQKGTNLVNKLNNRRNDKSSAVKKHRIKRIVPYSKTNDNFVFDRASEFPFKPLVWLHKTRKKSEDGRSIQNERNSLRTSLHTFSVVLTVVQVKCKIIAHLIMYLREVDAVIEQYHGESYSKSLKERMLKKFEYFVENMAPLFEMFHHDILNYSISENNKKHEEEEHTYHLRRAGASKAENIIKEAFNENNEPVMICSVHNLKCVFISFTTLAQLDEETASDEFDKEVLLDFLQRQSEESSRLNKGLKKRWVKRIVPHGTKTSDVIFDRATGISFKLVRIHKTKQVLLENVRRRENIHNERKTLPSTNSTINVSLPAIHVYNNKAANLIRILREVDAIVQHQTVQSVKQKMLEMTEDFDKKVQPVVEKLHQDIINVILKH